MTANILTALMFSIGILFLLFQLYPLFKGMASKGKKVTALTGVVSENVLNQKYYLLYIWGPNCGMCRNMTPMIDTLMQQRSDIAKIDVSQHSEAAKAVGVLGTPAIVLVEEGVIKQVSLGVKTKTAILALLNENSS